MKHKHDMRSICCPLKMLSVGNSLKTPDLDIDKNYKKQAQTVFLLIASTFYKSNLQ